MSYSFSPTGRNNPGPADLQRNPHPPQPGGAPRVDHQRRRPDGRLLLHPRRAPREDRRRVQRREAGPPGPPQRVHAERRPQGAQRQPGPSHRAHVPQNRRLEAAAEEGRR